LSDGHNLLAEFTIEELSAELSRRFDVMILFAAFREEEHKYLRHMKGGANGDTLRFLGALRAAEEYVGSMASQIAHRMVSDDSEEEDDE